MKIEVNEDPLREMAEKLQTTPRQMITGFLDFLYQLPNSVFLRARSDSLDGVIGKLMKSAEAGHVVCSLIDEFMEGRDYEIDDGGYSLEDETISFAIDFVESDHLDSMRIQFGRTAFTSATFHLDIGNKEEQYLREIDEILDSYDEEFEVDLFPIDDNTTEVEISCISRDVFGVVKISVFEEIARRIKKQHNA